MNWITDMNRLVGPRSAAEAHGVSLELGHRCTHACRVTVQPGTYHPLCRDRRDCVLDPSKVYDVSEAAEVSLQAWEGLRPAGVVTCCPWDQWKPARDVT